MQTSFKPGNLTCDEVRELLSDVLDARRGEIPHPDGTPLAEIGMRPGVELHLAGCAVCREDFRSLAAIGEAYSGYAVSERPTQFFENFGQKVRARMARQAQAANVGVPSGLRGDTRGTSGSLTAIFHSKKNWFAGVSALAAAAIALTLTLRAAGHLNRIRASTPDVVRAVHKWPSALAATQLNLLVPNGFQPVAATFNFNPNDQAGIKNLQENEGRYGYLIFGEKSARNELPLLGALLKTTRDEDRIVDAGPGGLMVYGVVEGSLAQAMGLRKNDHIVTINGEPVKNGGSLDAVKFLSGIHALGAGAPITLHVVRPVGSQWLFLKPMDGVLGACDSPLR